MKLCPDAFRLMKSWHQFKTSTGMLPNSETDPLVSQIYTKNQKRSRVSASLVFILFDIFELLFIFEGSVRFKLVPERLMVTNLFKQTSTVARVDNSRSLKVWNYRPETQEKLWQIKRIRLSILTLTNRSHRVPKGGPTLLFSGSRNASFGAKYRSSAEFQQRSVWTQP